MVVALNVDYEAIAHWTEPVENAERAAEVPGAPIVNVDANFLVPESERHTDLSFSRLMQLRAMSKVALRHGSLMSIADFPKGTMDERPYRRPDYAEEWRLLKKAWSLHRRGQDQLSQKRVEEASALFYRSEPLPNLLDWLWRFALFVGQPRY